jgi:hypothetical protein
MNPLALIPARAWLLAAGLIIAGLVYWQITDAAYDRGKAETTSTITRSNDAARSKADDAARTVENCIGTWDRSRGVCVPNGGTGR